MTALVFVLALVAAYVHLQVRGWYVFPDHTIYTVAFWVVLLCAAGWALWSRDRRAIMATGVLIVNLAATYWGWFNGDVLVNQAIIDTLTAAYFIFLGTTRWELAAGVVYLLSVASAALAHLDVIPGLGERPPIFLAFNYADITSLCGHAASIVLGLASGDGGKRIRRFLGARPVAFDHRRRAMARIARVAKVAED